MFKLELADFSLHNLIEKGQQFTDNQLLSFLKQTLEGLNFMAQKNLCHRDIKPHNLLIKDGIIKISDFGEAKIMMQKMINN